MKKLSIILFIVCAVILLSISASAAVDDDGYTLVTTPEEFMAISDDLGGNYRLANDIDFSETAFYMIGSENNPFAGSFDGAGYTLSNITISENSSGDLYSAVFASNEGIISNVVFDGISVTAVSAKNAYAAVVAVRNIGEITDVTVTNSTVYAKSDYFTARAGALTAYNYKVATVSGCTSDAVVKAMSVHLYADAAGIAAVNLGEITGCINSGEVTCTANSSDVSAGGICSSNSGDITLSDNSGDIRVVTDSGVAALDGICAQNYGNITDCENTGNTYEGEIEFICGDVDGDGEVTPVDGVKLSRYLASWQGYGEGSINASAADVNGNGSADPSDGVILSRYLAGWDGYKTLPYVK